MSATHLKIIQTGRVRIEEQRLADTGVYASTGDGALHVGESLPT